MMSAETETYAALTTGMGSPQPVQTRIYPDILPQEAPMPAIIYRRIGTDPVLTLRAPTSAAKVLIEIDTWARTRAEAEGIANAVQAAMIAAAHVPVEREGMQEEETGEYGVRQTFDVWEV